MFDSPDAAREYFLAHFERPRIEMLVESLQPAIGFAPSGGAAALGGTRLGGTPDLPPGVVWPKPAPPADPAKVASRAHPEAARELVEHYRLDLPYLFVAQVDLAEARSLGAVSAELPESGRLLFFYDMLAGPYDPGYGSGRVIWDGGPREALKAQAPPPSLAEASRKSRAARATFDDDRARLSRAGTNYEAPARPMRLTGELRMPASEALEAADRPGLKAALGLGGASGEDEALSESYSALFERYDRFFGAENAGRRNQLLGPPLPEQSDPRFDAVAVAEFGTPHLDGETWKARRAEIEAKARDWRLLLQIDVSDLMQDDLAEGTIYFVIRKADLAARRFDRAIAIYQQT